MLLNSSYILAFYMNHSIKANSQIPYERCEHFGFRPTNLQDFYDVPDRLPPFGLSDHMSIQVKPKLRANLPKGRFVVKSRDLRPSKRLAKRTYLREVNIPEFTNSVATCTEKASLLETIITTGLDMVLPLQSKTVHSSEPPWINPTLKNLIKKRQKALAQSNLQQF